MLSTSPPLPFQLDEENVDETLRIRYRWLDLRRDKLQRNIRLRAQKVSIIRRVMEGAGFLDIETPDHLQADTRRRARLPRSVAAPEGQVLRAPAVAADPEAAARDRRLRALLPDRPLLQRRGLRADRFNELTQLDVEMAFPDVEFIMALMEGMVQADLAGDDRC